jgi:hypothetical protein
LVRQRVYGLVVGYEDRNDHEELRLDPLMALLAGTRDIGGAQRRREQDRGKPGAGRSRLNRMESTPQSEQGKKRYQKIELEPGAVGELLVELDSDAQQRMPGVRPTVKIILRADSGFCWDALMSWCEEHGVGYVFGLARNAKLVQIIGQQWHEAQQEYERIGQAARVFTEFLYRTKKTWSRWRRVIAKAEHLAKGG